MAAIFESEGEAMEKQAQMTPIKKVIKRKGGCSLYGLLQINLPGSYPIVLFAILDSQDRVKAYEVRYGSDIRTNLSYEEAAAELGNAQMHALNCNFAGTLH